MELSDEERQEVIKLIQSGKPLPARYRASLFEDAQATELIWPGKTSEVETTVLPFQSIEQIDEPRSDDRAQLDLFSMDTVSGRQQGGWTNKLIWGDNKLILSSLANGPLREQIEQAGGLKLVYIDPPFDVGADFSVDVEIGGQEVTKKPSVIEEVAYRDTWGRGRDSYLSMLYPRLLSIRDILAPSGSVFVHVDWRLSGQVRLLLDEVFGSDRFRNEIVWHYSGWNKRLSSSFERRHDSIFFYTKGNTPVFNSYFEKWSSAADYVKKRKQKVLVDDDGRQYVLSDAGGGKRIKRFLDEVMQEGVVVDDVWHLDKINNSATEALGYATQKPESLLERIVSASTEPGDLVADFFCGSGTTLAVAERLGRKWLGVDLGRFAIHTSRKRLIQVQRELASEGEPYRAFEILNLGSYERQYFTGIDPTSSAEQKAAQSARKREQFLELILSAYEARRAEQLPPFHGAKGATAVFVGPLDAPITQDDVRSVIEAARSAALARADILGFEFEMGISPAMIDEAQEVGVSLTLRYIPRDVFDKRAIAKGDVKFYEVGYLEASPRYNKKDKLSVAISIDDFGVFYAQEDANAVAAGLGKKKSKVVVDKGQVVRVAKDATGTITREVLTKKWSDWIDYWAVDFNYTSQKEVITLIEDGQQRDLWTGRYIFENEWQSFRTRKDRDLELLSSEHTYDTPGTYKVAVKVIDVFGNDTTKVITVKVG